MTRRRAAIRGNSLTGLLVALLVAGVATAGALEGLLRTQVDGRRMGSRADASLLGAVVHDELEMLLSGAGSGFAGAGNGIPGCTLRAARNGTQVLPSTAAHPAPFATVPQTIPLAPVLVFAGSGGGGSAVALVAAAGGDGGGVPYGVQAGSVSSSGLRVDSALGLRPSDLVLLAQTGLGCMVQQVPSTWSASAGPDVALGGVYAASTIGGVAVTSFGVGGNAVLMPLGSETQALPLVRAMPYLMLLGVDATDGNLHGRELLRGVQQVLAPNVVDLRFRYGIDSNADRRVDTWASPAVSPWTAAELADGSAAANARLATILALRVGAVVRGDQPDGTDQTAATLTMFGDLDAALRPSYAVPAADRRFPHRVVDLVVTLRNARQAVS